MPESPALTAERIAEVDRSDLLREVLELPDQLRDAMWKVESAGLSSEDSAGGLVVAGMGGSGIGGALALDVLGVRATRPIVLVRDYALPAWTRPETTVLCASYSGDTEETLAAYDGAGALGARRIVVTGGGELGRLAREDGVPVIPVAGGMQPRCAVAYMTVAALEAAAVCGAGPSLRSELDVAAAHAEDLVTRWGPDAPEDSSAKALARALHGSVPVIAGSGPTAAVAYRWKTQLNENAKLPAFSHVLPELNHNEVVGWEGARELGPFSAVFLDDSDLHPRVRSRIELTRELVEPAAATTTVLAGEGETRTERIFALVLLGDLVSVYLAVLRGVDPTPVSALDELKSELAGAG
jgi:glucose/mannose-6-phosphate isomerase